MSQMQWKGMSLVFKRTGVPISVIVFTTLLWRWEWLLHGKVWDNWKKTFLLITHSLSGFNQGVAPFLLLEQDWSTCLSHWGSGMECPQAMFLVHTSVYGRNLSLRWDTEYLHFLNGPGKGQIVSPLKLKLWKEYNQFSFLCLRYFSGYCSSINSLPTLSTSPPAVYTS